MNTRISQYLQDIITGVFLKWPSRFSVTKRKTRRVFDGFLPFFFFGPKKWELKGQFDIQPCILDITWYHCRLLLRRTLDMKLVIDFIRLDVVDSTIGCCGFHNWMLWIPQHCRNQTRGTRFLVRLSLHLFYWVVLRSPQLWNNQQHSFWCCLNYLGTYCMTTLIDRNNFGIAWIITNCW